MMIDVMAELGPVNFCPATELEEVLQNVRTIITTRKGSVPMDREFGIDGDIQDLPIGVAQAKLSAEIVEAVNRFEPRARVKQVIYDGNEQDGLLRAKVRVAINGTEGIE